MSEDDHVHSIPVNPYGFISVVCETFLYGVYCHLFFRSMGIVIKKRSTRTNPSKIFLGTSVIIFVLTTAHILLNLFRLVDGYAPSHWIPSFPLVNETILFASPVSKINVARVLLAALVTILGDGLVIYRCFLVWNSFPVIVLPTLLLIASIVTNIALLAYLTFTPYGDSSNVFSATWDPAISKWITAVYAITLAQNVLTTTLIAWRIWKSESSFKAISRVRSSLMPIVWIIIESALIYVVQLLLLISLYVAKHQAQFIFQEAIVPTVGIVFTLISVRVAVTTSSNSTTRAPLSLRFNMPSASGTRSEPTPMTFPRRSLVEGEGKVRTMDQP